MFDRLHMQDWASLPLVPELVKFQLGLLDTYEKLLASQTWDEAELNQALKGLMASLLPLMQARDSLRELLLSSHKGLLEQYRRLLEEALRSQEESRG